MLRPEEGYMQMIEYIIHSPENITSYEISTLLSLLIIIPLIIYRKRVYTNIKNFVRSHVVKQAIQDFDKDDDEMLSREEYQDFISVMMEDFEEGEEKDINLDDFFDKYDSNKEGKLDGDEISSILLEVFDYFRTEESIRNHHLLVNPLN